MDSYKAKEWEQRLAGKYLLDYEIVKYVGNGKSAVVFRAVRPSDGMEVAIKIFDDTLIER